LERILRQFYTLEFKEEAVSLVIDGGLTVAEVGRQLSISQQTLRNWIKKHRTTGLKTPGSRSVSELEAEVSRLRKELAETRLEKEILKKAMAYLAKEPRGGTR
jgi:transposase